MKDGLDETTLQINLCAGDAAYAHLTVPPLVAAHPRAAARLAIVDCCRPQRTRIFDPEIRVPEPKFRENLAAIRKLAEVFRSRGLFDRIEYLEPGDSRFPGLARRFVRRWATETHDYGGCGFMAYWAALGFPRTRFVLHYDADMILHQDPGHDWEVEARVRIGSESRVVAAIPRISPPFPTEKPQDDAPSRHEGRPREPVVGGWLNDWFSTRCFLFDLDKLGTYEPLIGAGRSLTMLLRRALDRGYPPGPEQLLWHRLGSAGARCFNLSARQAWLLHPRQKGPEFVRLLPRVLASVAAGRVPDSQRGFADLRLDDWKSWLDSDTATVSAPGA